MERLPPMCSTCQAVIVHPPLEPDGLGLQLRLCACCEQFLAWDAFAQGQARAGARRCIACASGPYSQAFWHRPRTPEPKPATDSRQQSLALVAAAMGPPQPPRRVVQERINRRRRRWKPRQRNKHPRNHQKN